MITLNEIICSLKKQVDPEAESIMVRLIKKTTDTNNFIGEEVRKTCVSLCQMCSEPKILPTLFNYVPHKATPIKLMVILAFDAMIEKNGMRFLQMRDSDRIVVCLANYIVDSSVDARTSAKGAFSRLVKYMGGREELDRILQRGINDSTLTKVRTFMEKEINLTDASPLHIKGSFGETRFGKSITRSSNTPDDNGGFGISRANGTDNWRQGTNGEGLLGSTKGDLRASSKSRASNGGSSQSRYKEPADFERLPNMYAATENNDWRVRNDVISEFTEMSNKYYETLPRSKHFSRFFDCFMKLVADQNLKVASSALDSFTHLVPKLKFCIEGTLNIVMNVVYSTLSSTNASIKNKSEFLLDTIIKYVDNSGLVQSMCGGVLYANARSKPIILNKLIEIMEDVVNEKSVMYNKNIANVVIKLLEENKAELRPGMLRLAQRMHSIIGSKFFELIPSAKAATLKELLGQRQNQTCSGSSNSNVQTTPKKLYPNFFSTIPSPLVNFVAKDQTL
eukprot:TRINITY_DN2125_c0_g1_i2.p1 TRINITY_DN2125_c0_g1~~TRINITY_DN2125_c0_g1_i2.p1  ORF type:complete len:507 (+),score=31.93 TRINITY_DN2125_c0_g1_i2:406-1926(+)